MKRFKILENAYNELKDNEKITSFKNTFNELYNDTNISNENINKLKHIEIIAIFELANKKNLIDRMNERTLIDNDENLYKNY